MITNAASNVLTIDGYTIQHDASGMGYAWRDVAADDTLGGCLDEIAAEVIDGGRVIETIIASNGCHYRAV